VTGPAGFLTGLRVLEAGDGPAGSSATALLGSLGAEVTKLVNPGGASRRQAPSLSDGAGLQALLLDEAKIGVTDPEAGAGLLGDPSAFDVVVCDRIAGATGPIPADLDDYVALVASRNPGVWVTISAYGLRGPDRERTGSELTVAAASGLLSAVRDPRTGAPVKLAGTQALLAAGQVAALAACHGLERVRVGPPVHLDVSAQEAAIATGPVLRCVHALLNCVGDAGARRYGAPAGFYSCRDGIVRISAMENHQWEGLVRAFGSPAWAEPFAASEQRSEQAELVDARIQEITARMTKRECEEVLQHNGVPATAMNSPEELLGSPQFAARGCLREVEVGGVIVRVVGPPVPSGAEGASLPSPATGLAGLRVVEAGHVLAVPLAGALLGAMGATVTKLEDPKRLDMYRRRGPFIDGEPGIDRAAYFAFVNHSKTNRLVSLDDDPAALGPILDACDVIVENYGPGRARRLGVDAATLGRERPALLAVSSSGFGHTGPWSGYRAYAYNLQTSCCLNHLTRTREGEPAEIDLAWADLISGFAIATLVAAWAVGPGGRTGVALDFSMAEYIASRLNEYLAAASCGRPAGPEDGTNHQYPYAPSGTYPTADPAGWIALSVASEAQWAALKAALGNPGRLDDGRFGSAASRWDDHAALDEALGALTRQHRAAALADLLQAEGVPASAVLLPADLITDPHLASRGFFAAVEHPVWGLRRLIGLPWQVLGEGPLPLGPPPLLDSVAVGGGA